MRPHRTDGVSLSFGLLFLLIAAWWAASRLFTVQLPATGWLIAGSLLLFGAIGLLGAIRPGRRAPEPVQATATTEPARPVETPGDLPPEMHASIVRELLDDTAERFRREHPDVKPEQSGRE